MEISTSCIYRKLWKCIWYKAVTKLLEKDGNSFCSTILVQFEWTNYLYINWKVTSMHVTENNRYSIWTLVNLVQPHEDKRKCIYICLTRFLAIFIVMVTISGYVYYSCFKYTHMRKHSHTYTHLLAGEAHKLITSYSYMK